MLTAKSAFLSNEMTNFWIPSPIKKQVMSIGRQIFTSKTSNEESSGFVWSMETVITVRLINMENRLIRQEENCIDIRLILSAQGILRDWGKRTKLVLFFIQ